MLLFVHIWFCVASRVTMQSEQLFPEVLQFAGPMGGDPAAKIAKLADAMNPTITIIRIGAEDETDMDCSPC
jgi:hypothetical protein